MPWAPDNDHAVREAASLTGHAISLTGHAITEMCWCFGNLNRDEWTYWTEWASMPDQDPIYHFIFFRREDYMMFMMVWV